MISNHSFHSKIVGRQQHKRIKLQSSVVDQDPVGSKTFSKIRKLQFRIRIAPDQKWIWSNLLWENWYNLTISQTKCLIKIKIPFYNNKISLKSLYIFRHNMQPNILGWEYKCKFMLRILEKIHVGSETKSCSGSGKNHSRSTTLLQSTHLPELRPNIVLT